MSAATTRFDRDTAAEALGDGRYGVRFHPAWWVVAGPNGGYVSAILLRAMRAELGSDERVLRSLTVHFTAAPREGEAEVSVRVERAGRSLTTVSARLTQGDRLAALALAAFSGPYPPAASYEHSEMPDVPAPEDVPEPERGGAFEPPPFAANFSLRPLFGPPPFSGGERALAGGWLRFRDPRPLDELALVALADAWYPAPFGVVERPSVAPTVDLTIHLRAPLPREHDHVLVELRSDTARDGLFDEDARLWARDGTLLANARQLALLL